MLEVCRTNGRYPSSDDFRVLGEKRYDKTFPVYLRTNEVALGHVTDILTRSQRAPRGCHIGFSGWHNFNIISDRRSEFGIICDKSWYSTELLEGTFRILRDSTSKEDFKVKIRAYIAEVSSRIPIELQPYRDASGRGKISTTIEEELEVALSKSWFSNEENFRYIKMLATTRRMVAITVDIFDKPRIDQIVGICRKNHLLIDTVYLTNIRQYVPKDREQDFLSSVNSLIRTKTLIISCPRISRAGEEDFYLEQVIFDGGYLHDHQDSLLQITAKS